MQELNLHVFVSACHWGKCLQMTDSCM